MMTVTIINKQKDKPSEDVQKLEPLWASGEKNGVATMENSMGVVRRLVAEGLSSVAEGDRRN